MKTFEKIDKQLEVLLKSIYSALESKEEIEVSPPEYSETAINSLVEKGLIDVIDSSTMSGWSYIVRPTYLGENYFKEKEQYEKEHNREKRIDFVKGLYPWSYQSFPWSFHLCCNEINSEKRENSQ